MFSLCSLSEIYRRLSILYIFQKLSFDFIFSVIISFSLSCPSFYSLCIYSIVIQGFWTPRSSVWSRGFSIHLRNNTSGQLITQPNSDTIYLEITSDSPGSVFRLLLKAQPLSTLVKKSWRQSFGWIEKDSFSRQRETYWASVFRICVSQLRDLEEGFIKVCQMWSLWED